MDADTSAKATAAAAASSEQTAPALTPERIEELAADGDFAAISRPNLSPVLDRYFERN